MLLADAIAEYLTFRTDVGKVAKSTVGNDHDTLSHFLNFFGDNPPLVEEMSAKTHVDPYVQYLSTTPGRGGIMRTDATINQARTRFRNFAKWLMAEEYTEKDLSARWLHRREGKVVRETLTTATEWDDSMQRARATGEKEGLPLMVPAAWAFHLYGFCRLDEREQALLCNVNLQTGTIKIKGKGRDERLIEMSAEFMQVLGPYIAWLRDVCEKEDPGCLSDPKRYRKIYVFPGGRKSYAQKRFNPYVPRPSLRKLMPAGGHVGRRAGGQALDDAVSEAGGDGLRAAQAAYGHQDVRTTQLYLSRSRGRRAYREAVNGRRLTPAAAVPVLRSVERAG